MTRYPKRRGLLVALAVLLAPPGTALAQTPVLRALGDTDAATLPGGHPSVEASAPTVLLAARHTPWRVGEPLLWQWPPGSPLDPAVNATALSSDTLTSLTHIRSIALRHGIFQEEQEGDPVLKYIGVGLMVVGGINTLYSASCAFSGGDNGSACLPYFVVSAGIGVGGWFLFDKNR